jgi:hypothetical protein
MQNHPLVTLVSTSSIPLKNLKVGIFIDNSGSTAGNIAHGKVLSTTILLAEKQISSLIASELTHPPKYVKWSTNSEIVESLHTITSDGNTLPSTILTNPTIKSIIDDIEVAIILTDGDIDIGEINKFAKEMNTKALHLKAIIGIIIKSIAPNSKPANTNVSVLVPAMLNNSCILYHDVSNTYIMWSAGCFKNTWNHPDITDDLQWQNLKTIDPLEICNMSIPIYPQNEIDALIAAHYIPFGSGCFFEPNRLLLYQPSWDELLRMPFDRICQYFKMNNRYDELMKWFKSLKDRFLNEFMGLPQADMNTLVSNLLNKTVRAVARNSSHVSSYTRMRDHILLRRNFDEYDDVVFSNPQANRLAQFFRRMMPVMQEDQETVHAPASYTSASISVSRYTTKLSKSLSLSVPADFTKPLKWFKQFNYNNQNHKSTQADCTICFEKSVPFFLLRKHFDCNNLEDITANPFTYYYPGVLCAKCADYFCGEGFDPNRVPCYAGIPIVKLVDTKNYLECFAKLTKLKPNETSTGLLSSISKKLNWFSRNYKGTIPDINNDPLMTTIKTIKTFIDSLIKYFNDDNDPLNESDKKSMLMALNESRGCYDQKVD